MKPAAADGPRLVTVMATLVSDPALTEDGRFTEISRSADGISATSLTLAVLLAVFVSPPDAPATELAAATAVAMRVNSCASIEAEPMDRETENVEVAAFAKPKALTHVTVVPAAVVPAAVHLAPASPPEPSVTPAGRERETDVGPLEVTEPPLPTTIVTELEFPGTTRQG